MLIKELPIDERPRERFLLYGKDNLSNQELLAIIVRSGSNGCSVNDIVDSILKQINNINELCNLSLNNLVNIKGMRESKAITLLASIELGKRIYSSELIEYMPKINSSSNVYNYFKNYFFNKKQKEFLAIYLDNKKKLIKHLVLFKGTLNQSLVHPREVFKEAVLVSASSIIVCHNHPSGDVTPSNEDLMLTSNLLSCGKIMQIPIIDHLIITNNEYFSFLEHNLIK